MFDISPKDILTYLRKKSLTFSLFKKNVVTLGCWRIQRLFEIVYGQNRHHHLFPLFFFSPPLNPLFFSLFPCYISPFQTIPRILNYSSRYGLSLQRDFTHIYVCKIFKNRIGYEMRMIFTQPLYGIHYTHREKCDSC